MTSRSAASTSPRREPAALAAEILSWFDRHARVLPWRARPGERADPYAVWLSEIMLQQTTVAAVGPYFQHFMRRWPSVEALAAAPVEEVMREWAGLGYYARARNLHHCAQAVVTEHRGVFPDTEEGLRALPGIGAYTAAAIAAIAFDRPAAVCDGNVERVMARLHAVEEPLPRAKPLLRRLAQALTPGARPGDYAQAVMDLGATICTPRAPRCMLCPWALACAARAAGDPERYPLKEPRRERPLRHGVAFWLTRPDGQVLLRRRPARGLLGGMVEVPSTEWREAVFSPAEARAAAPAPLRWLPIEGVVSHGFTHFELELAVWRGRAAADAAIDGWWCPIDRLGDAGLPTVMKKIAGHALRAEDGGAARSRRGPRRRAGEG